MRIVTLEDVLKNREHRVHLQQTALATLGRPLLSITLVNPGPEKDTTQARELMSEALAAVRPVVAERYWQVLYEEVRCEPTGPEALLAVNVAALDLKQMAVRLEDTHPLGRLWDIDVINLDGRAISRRALSLPDRRCLLCGEEARVCTRSAAHPLPELLKAIRKILDDYRNAESH